MPVISVTTDSERLTMNVVADFPVPVRRLWDAYADPRQIERFWGPPGYPATFTRHDLFPGGRSEYFMTGPDGTRSFCFWEFLAVEEGHSFEVQDGWTAEDGEPSSDMPSVRVLFAFDETPDGSRLTSSATFPSSEAMGKLVSMGVVEGTKAAMAQIDQVVSDLVTFAPGRALEWTLIGDDRVRITRVLRGTLQQVWHAHHDSELIRRWMYGPEGWSISECTPAVDGGEHYRYVFEPSPGVEGRTFAIGGELLESVPPRREVSLESMEGIEGPPARNVQTFIPVGGGTLLSLVITYASAEQRDMVLGTGMTDGMEITYSRLENVLAR